MRLFPAVLVAAVVLFASPAMADEIPDTPEPWLYAVAIPPVEVESVAMVAEVDEVEPQTAPAAEPPTIAMTGAEARTAALMLPSTVVTFELHGDTVHVVAWLEGTNQTGFVFERSDGTRGYVTTADRPTMSYVLPVTDDPCVDDPFGVLPPISC